MSRRGICGVTVIAEVAETSIATDVEATGVAIVDTCTRGTAATTVDVGTRSDVPGGTVAFLLCLGLLKFIFDAGEGSTYILYV